MLLKRQFFLNKDILLRTQRFLAKSNCTVLGNVSDVRCFCAARLKKKKIVRNTRTREQWQLVKKFERETTLDDGSRVPGWEALSLYGPSKMGHMKTGRKQARRKLAGPAMLRWYKPRMEEVMDRVWDAEIFYKENPSYYNSKKYIDLTVGEEEEEKILFKPDARVHFISRAKQTKMDRMDRRKRAGKGTPKKGQGKRSGKKN
eukprot:g7182.t1